MNHFAYGQTFLFYQEDMRAIKEKYGKNIILEQDGTTELTCKINKYLLEKLFTSEDGSEILLNPLIWLIP